MALAATLGACSFEAYNAPYRIHGVKEVDDNHAETVYMHRPFLDRIMAGILQVRDSGICTLLICNSHRSCDKKSPHADQLIFRPLACLGARAASRGSGMPQK